MALKDPYDEVMGLRIPENLYARDHISNNCKFLEIKGS
jgi:hypothetical protein